MDSRIQFLSFFLGGVAGFHVAQDGLQLTMRARLALNFRSSTLHILMLGLHVCVRDETQLHMHDE